MYIKSYLHTIYSYACTERIRDDLLHLSCPLLYIHTCSRTYIHAICAQVRTEDDVLHLSSLPDFGGNLGQRDSELLLSFLTVPYLRIPLIMNFFASDNRVQALKSRQLRDMLEHALVEPARYACMCIYIHTYIHTYTHMGSYICGVHSHRGILCWMEYAYHLLILL
jgi:hypothetical protein